MQATSFATYIHTHAHTHVYLHANACTDICKHVPFAVSSSMFTHTEIVEQQSTG